MGFIKKPRYCKKRGGMDYPAMAISQIGLAHIFALSSITKILCESIKLRFRVQRSGVQGLQVQRFRSNLILIRTVLVLVNRYFVEDE
jgi:hypothetical protein